MATKVSIIVPTYNAEKTIKDCIESILSINYKNYEAIFVDDGSTDNTVSIIEEFACKSKNIKLVKQKHKGPASARNLGVKMSNGKIIFFTDSDCIVPKNWIREFLKYFFSDENIGAVGGSLKPASTSTIYEIFDQKRREILYGAEKKFVNALPTCNLAVRRDVFNRIGGFDESFKHASAEDYDLCIRIRMLGYRILYDPNVFVLHYHSQNLRSLLRKAFIHGKEYIKLKRKHKESDFSVIKNLLISILSPVTVLIKYPISLLPVALLYECSASIGRIVGLWKYALLEPRWKE